MKTIHTILAFLWLALLALVVTPTANAAANTNVTALLDGANDTFDYALPLGLGIMGTFLAVALGRTAWKRFAK